MVVGLSARLYGWEVLEPAHSISSSHGSLFPVPVWGASSNNTMATVVALVALLVAGCVFVNFLVGVTIIETTEEKDRIWIREIDHGR
jgi:hypothetical protein